MLAIYILAVIAVYDTSVQVTVITTLGVVVVALIGVFTARITTGAKRDALSNAESASTSAAIAKDYAAALGAKDALIASLLDRVEFLEKRDEECTKRVEDLEIRVSEGEEQRRSASILEHEHFQEVTKLQEEIIRLRAQR